jgi:hypothetical protein
LSSTLSFASMFDVKCQTQTTRSYSTPWAPILQSIQPKVFVKRGCSSDYIDYDMYNVGARPLKVRLRAGSTKEGENQRPPKTRHYRTYYSYRYVGSLYSVGEHHYIANTISCSDVLGLGRAITTSYHDELSRRAITTSYHDELSRRAITTSYHDELSRRD